VKDERDIDGVLQNLFIEAEDPPIAGHALSAVTRTMGKGTMKEK